MEFLYYEYFDSEAIHLCHEICEFASTIAFLLKVPIGAMRTAQPFSLDKVGSAIHTSPTRTVRRHGFP
jgi:hypothetical protein